MQATKSPTLSPLERSTAGIDYCPDSNLKNKIDLYGDKAAKQTL